jgi:hypothetical protein
MEVKPVGMPGPGGSLGECCHCGRPFLAETFGVGLVKEVFVSCAPNQTFYVHEKCLGPFSKTEDIKDLPDGSMIKKAWLKQQPEAASL